jgi:hypothetical protein
MEEMWVVSHRSASGGLVGLWWLSEIASIFAGQVITKSYTGALAGHNAIDAMASGKLFLLGIGSDLVELVLTVLTLVLVTRITAAYKQHIVEDLAYVPSAVVAKG